MNPNFDSISPSAKSLLLTKSLTNIPFAKEAAKIIMGDNTFSYSQERLSSIGFLLRLIHFEKRYYSIDKALKELGIKNICEFSSGFSFRGLSMCKDPEICYIDTDLPQIIKIKELIIQELNQKFCDYSIGNLLLRPLDVLDKNDFTKCFNNFSNSPIVLVNEGLLIYFDIEQKRKLCCLIYNLLSEREGYWITSDIYIKNEVQDTKPNGFYETTGEQFLVDHNVEENKFVSFESAEVFFKEFGFDIYMKIDVPTTQLSSRKFLGRIPRDKIIEIKNRQKVRETWILKPKD